MPVAPLLPALVMVVRSIVSPVRPPLGSAAGMSGLVRSGGTGSYRGSDIAFLLCQRRSRPYPSPFEAEPETHDCAHLSGARRVAHSRTAAAPVRAGVERATDSRRGAAEGA